MKALQHSKESDSNQAINNETTANESAAVSNDFVDNSPEAIEARQLQALADNSQDAIEIQAWQDKIYDAEMQKENNTGIPNDLKVAVENASGLSLNAIRVHYNSEKPAAVDAHAYADYPNIYIAKGQEQHLEEEVWHMVQQMQNQANGTEIVNNTLVDSDPSREREAKTKGNKAPKMPFDPQRKLQTKKGKGGIIQRARIEKESNYGTFSIEEDEYKFDKGEDRDAGNFLNLDLEFMPNENADATKVGLTQVVRSTVGGKAAPFEPIEKDKMTKNGSLIDQLAGNRNPLYATDQAPLENDDQLNAYEPDSKYVSRHGVKKDDVWESAKITDKPTVDGAIRSAKEFETSALALEGNDADKYYGSVKWGFSQMGKKMKIKFDLVSKGVPSKNFLEAAKKWNESKVRGTARTTKRTQTKNLVGGRFESEDGFKLPKDKYVELADEQENKGGYVYVKIDVSDNAVHQNFAKGTTNFAYRYVKIADLKDVGDGLETVNLPLEETKLVSKNAEFYQDKNSTGTPQILDKNTRLKVIEKEGDMVNVEIIDAENITTGWMKAEDLKDEFTP